MEHALIILKRHIDGLLDGKERVVIAIDGSCASGKTTLADALSGLYDCNLVHMDDFFLRPEQRTPERLAEIGGNVDYERFRDEVLEGLRSGAPFAYRPYHCQTGTLAAPVVVTPKKLTIVEGSYSLHPYFGQPYELRIFLTVTEETRRQRILQRPAFLHKRFFEEWIPMEQRYFDGFAIRESCHLVLDTAQKD